MVNEQLEIEIAENHRIIFKWCPATPEEGMLLGSPVDEPDRYDDEQLKGVKLDGFWIQESQFTQKSWYELTGENPSYFPCEQMDYPVEQVSKSAVLKLISKLENQVSPPEGWGWDLPTEEQWEYACRAGTFTATHFGNVLNSQMANFNGYHPYGDTAKLRSPRHPLPVKSFPPNEWGLYDMHGNVWEWCKDEWKLYEFWGEMQMTHIIRGGSWDNHGKHCRSAVRDHFGDYPDYRIGFRLCLTPR